MGHHWRTLVLEQAVGDGNAGSLTENAIPLERFDGHGIFSYLVLVWSI